MAQANFDKKHLIKKSSNIEVILNLTKKQVEIYEYGIIRRVILSTRTAEEFVKSV